MLPPGSSILTGMEKTSVMLNGVLVRLNSAPDSMVRFCKPLAFYNHDPQYELSFAGTCFLAKFRQRLVLITTRHQLGKGHGAREPNDACVILETRDGRHALTCSEYASPTFPDNPQFKVAEDIIFLKFDAGVHSVDPTKLFFDLTHTRTMDEVREEDTKLYFAICYPTESAELKINFDDPENVLFEGYVSRFSKLYLETSRNESMPSHIEFRTRQDHMLTLNSYDGLSGSPVFFVYQDGSQQCHLGFAGMIRLAGNNIFHVYEGRYIKQMLERL